MKIVLLILFIILLIRFPELRFVLLHPFLNLFYAIKDLYIYIIHHRWNEFKAYGRMTMYVANDKQPFGSGKTLNLVRYVVGVYKLFNGRKVWSKSKKAFVPQEIRIFSNIKLKGIPYIPLSSEKQIIEASELSDDWVVQLFVIDEMGAQWNNRNWKNNLNEDLLTAILQQRKSKIAILGTVQDFSLFDATMRKVTTNVFECSKHWRLLTLREFYARDLERASSNSDLIAVRSIFVGFATDKLYNSYDTTEKVIKMSKEIEAGDRLSNQEILEASGNVAPELSTLTRIKKKYRKRATS